ncbi:MAG TPA: hypothetical protein VFT91_11635 [Dehalococcoidia bacterium]|nr:hypothetical protein [Dehalococcoidia bacterium]
MKLFALLAVVVGLAVAAVLGVARAGGGPGPEGGAPNPHPSPAGPAPFKIFTARESAAAADSGTLQALPTTAPSTASCTPPSQLEVNGQVWEVPSGVSICERDGAYEALSGRSWVQFGRDGQIQGMSIWPEDARALNPLLAALGLPPAPPCNPVPPPPWFEPGQPWEGDGPPPDPAVNGRPLPVPSCATIYPEDGGVTIAYGQSYVRIGDNGEGLEVAINPEDADEMATLMEALKPADGAAP